MFRCFIECITEFILNAYYDFGKIWHPHNTPLHTKTTSLCFVWVRIQNTLNEAYLKSYTSDEFSILGTLKDRTWRPLAQLQKQENMEQSVIFTWKNLANLKKNKIFGGLWAQGSKTAASNDSKLTRHCRTNWFSGDKLFFSDCSLYFQQMHQSSRKKKKKINKNNK